MAKKRITIYQSSPKEEYPSLHLMVTDNPRYWKTGVMVLDDPEEIAIKVLMWLKNQMKEKPENDQSQG